MLAAQPAGLHRRPVVWAFPTLQFVNLNLKVEDTLCFQVFNYLLPQLKCENWKLKVEDAALVCSSPSPMVPSRLQNWLLPPRGVRLSDRARRGLPSASRSMACLPPEKSTPRGLNPGVPIPGTAAYPFRTGMTIGCTTGWTSDCSVVGATVCAFPSAGWA